MDPIGSLTGNKARCLREPTPSNADFRMTKQIADIAGSIGIAVHDHVIVGRGGHVGVKGLRLI
jgi:DNA repair protein RadC